MGAESTLMACLPDTEACLCPQPSPRAACKPINPSWLQFPENLPQYSLTRPQHLSRSFSLLISARPWQPYVSECGVGGPKPNPSPPAFRPTLKENGFKAKNMMQSLPGEELSF